MNRRFAAWMMLAAILGVVAGGCARLFAFRAHERIPGSKLIIAERSGHSMGEPEIEKALLEAVREFE